MSKITLKSHCTLQLKSNFICNARSCSCMHLTDESQHRFRDTPTLLCGGNFSINNNQTVQKLFSYTRIFIITFCIFAACPTFTSLSQFSDIFTLNLSNSTHTQLIVRFLTSRTIGEQQDLNSGFLMNYVARRWWGEDPEIGPECTGVTRHDCTGRSLVLQNQTLVSPPRTRADQVHSSMLIGGWGSSVSKVTGYRIRRGLIPGK